VNVNLIAPSFDPLDAHSSRCAAHLELPKSNANSFEPYSKVSQRGHKSPNTRRNRAAPQFNQTDALTQLMEEHLNSLQERTYNSARRIQAFLDANDAVLGTINKSGMRAELDAVVAALGQSGTQQAAGRVNSIGETARQRTLRSALRLNYMQPIASVARAKLRTVPNFQAMTMPDPSIRVIGLLAHATGMAEAAAPYAEVFVAAGLPQDFLSKLTAAADAVKASIDARAAARGQRTGATGTLKALVNRARLAIRALNALAVPILTSDVLHTGLLAEWKRTRRVEARGGPSLGAEQAARAIDTPSAPTPDAASPNAKAHQAAA
jgi:hypothetical protein